MKLIKKRENAQSEIITTVLIILLVLVAIIIVWNVVKRTVVTGTEGIGTSAFTTNLEIQEVILPVTGGAEVKVHRGAGEGEITSLKFIFYDEDGESHIAEKTENLPAELETKIYDFTFEELDIVLRTSCLGILDHNRVIEKVSVVPMFDSTTGVEASEVVDKSTRDGVYWIDPDGSSGEEPFPVYCDMTTDGGGWTILISHPLQATTQNPLSDYGTVSVDGTYSIWSKRTLILYSQILYKPTYDSNLWAHLTPGTKIFKYTDTGGAVYTYTATYGVGLSSNTPAYSTGCSGCSPNGCYGLVLMEQPSVWCTHDGYGFGLSGGDMRGCHYDSWKWNWGGSPGGALQCPDPSLYKSERALVGIR